MNSLVVITFLAVGAAANSYGLTGSNYGSGSGYGSSSSSYGQTHIPIMSFNRNIQGASSDSSSFTTANGINNSHNVQTVRGRPSSYMDEYGRMVQTDSSIEMSGHSYHQTPEGQHVSLTWKADHNGFQASGDHLPKSVPLPAEHVQAHRDALAQVGLSNNYGSGSSYNYNAPTRNAFQVNSYAPLRSGY